MDSCSEERVDNQYFMHTDTETGQPISQPLCSIEDVIMWQPGFDQGCVATQPLVTKASREATPRTLVCHDMAGGYLEDRFVQGVQKNDCYRFYNWSMVDIFVYFSHHFITIPPQCWVESAHKNGVPVLGTIITEWAGGEQICSQFLYDQKTISQFVTKLVSIANYYQFDGWLINIENVIEQEDIQKLECFVVELNREMHKSQDGSLVIWYDSVIDTGELKWQNELNDSNRMFFDACDGIFLNYTWKEDNLERSVKTAGDRILDVYVGVDVFGRGCFGGGGLNTVEAMKKVRSSSLSAAIFAPGWVYEKMGRNDFVSNEKLFWELLTSVCNPSELTSLPLVTTFCQGWGDAMFCNGASVRSRPWVDLSQQSLQPYGPVHALSYDTASAFCGGGSLRISDIILQDCSKTLLFQTNIKIDPETCLYVSYVYRCNDNTELAIELEFDEGDTVVINQNKIICSSRVVDLLEHGDEENIPQHLLPTRSEDWRMSWCAVAMTSKKVLRSVSAVLTAEGSCPLCVANLGALRILTDDHLGVPVLSNLEAINLSNKAGSPQASVILTWDCDTPVDFFLVDRFLENGDWEMVGTSCTSVFKVCQMVCKEKAQRFRVCAVFSGGCVSRVEDAPEVTVMWT